jgi:NTP pyrophosphatase (non-canonical NTP hydrolase)
MNIKIDDMKIKKLVSESYKNAEEKGFWKHYDTILHKMKKHNNFSVEEIEAFRISFINQKIMLVVSELSEMMESLRNSKITECDSSVIDDLRLQFEENPELFYMRFVHHIKDTFEDELADVMIRLGDLIGKLGIDIDSHIELKQKFNSLREDMHGKKF